MEKAEWREDFPLQIKRTLALRVAHRFSKGKERHEARWKEVDEGKIKMPREPRMLYVLTGSGFDAAKGEVLGAYLRWVVYAFRNIRTLTGLNLPYAESKQAIGCSETVPD